MVNGLEKIQEKINSFKRRYYLNLLVRGLILTFSILFFYFLIAALLEYTLWFGPWARFFILLSFFATAFYCVFRFLRGPLAFWISRKGMDDEQSARLIGNSLPTIKDGLLNIIQLSVSADSGLAVASIQQKSKEFEPVSFDSVIHLSQNKKYLKYLAIPVGLILLLMIFNQAIITQSTNRIVNFNQKFSPQAPFKFVVQNKLLTGFFNEDFVLKISLEGSAIPDAAYLTMGSQNLKMENLGNGSFQYVFGKTEDLAEFGRVSRGSVLLTLAGSLDDMSLARQVIPQTVDLSVMVLERHPIPAEDRQIEALCRLWPFHMRLGYFLALDDAVQCRCIHPTTVVLLQQLGLRDHELITSHMLTQRIETVLTREALQNKSQRPAESPEQWFALNRS